MMIYQDRVYGQVTIKEPVILELIKSQAVQRLKGVDQAGYRALLVKPELKIGKHDHSRYAHSLGVYTLLAKYNASLEERISGLIHDVSHTAFSHCIDYTLEAGSPKDHSYQDRIFNSFVQKTEIPAILEKYGFSPDFILDEKNFPLLEKKVPDLCADRLDYSLRTAVLFGEVDSKFINNLLSNLFVRDNNWVFKNLKVAKSYAELFLKLNTRYYASYSAAMMFSTVGNFLKYALIKGYLKKDDLFTTDREVLKKVNRYLVQDSTLNLHWKRMNSKLKTPYDSEGFETGVFVKSRIIDPLFIHKDKITRLSDYHPEWKKIVEKELLPKKYFPI